MEGVGSIWNKNSWHWEEKNETKRSKDFLIEHMEAIKADALTPRATEIKVVKVSE